MMNYTEQVITDPKILNRVLSSSEQSNQLSVALAQLSIQPADRPSIAGGLFSRITSSMFSSYESGVRCSFVASCKVETEFGDSNLLVGVKEGGKCSLVRTEFQTSPPSAVELKSVEISRSSEGYAASSIFLGRSQGSLVAVSAGEGQIHLLTVKGESMSLWRNIQIPVVVPITGLLLAERGSSAVELYAVLARKQVVVVPDITKPGEYYFVLTRSLREQMKISEFSSISEESIEFAWNNRFVGDVTSSSVTAGPVPVKSSLLLMSQLNSFTTYSEYRSIFLLEKVIELFRVRNPTAGSSIPQIMKSECMQRLSRESTMDSLALAIAGEVSRIESQLNIGGGGRDYEIKSIFRYDDPAADSRRIILSFANPGEEVVSEIMKIAESSLVEKFVYTFQSAPFVFSFINQRLSRESVLGFFPAAEESWVSFFACASIFEAIGGAAGDVISQMATSGSLFVEVLQERISKIPSEVKEHIESILKRLAEKKGAKRLEIISSLLIQKELTRLDDEKSITSWGQRIEVVEKLCKYYIIYAVYCNCQDQISPDVLRTLKRLAILKQIDGGFKCELSLSHSLNRIEQLYLSHPDLEAAFLCTTSELALHAGFRNFQTARILAASPTSDETERDLALSLFRDSETELSLFADKFSSAPDCCPPQLKYLFFVTSAFGGDYKREMPLLTQLASRASGSLEFKEMIQRKVMENAIANGDWKRVKSELANIPSTSPFKQHAVRLVCTEARIRNELFAVFELIAKENRELISSIIGEIEMDMEKKKYFPDMEKFYLQIFSLYVFVNDFPNALRTVNRWYRSLLCPLSATTSASYADLSEDEEVAELGVRLEQQIKAATLAHSIEIKMGKSNTSNMALKNLILAESLAAFYSFSPDNADPILSEGTVSVQLLCRNLSALGLVIQAAKLAGAFCFAKNPFFSSVIAPYLELLLKCEKDLSYLPPCRWEQNEGAEKKNFLIPLVSPGMAFVRSDASGPIGGSQIACMRRALEFVLRKNFSSSCDSGLNKHLTLAALEYLMLTKGEDKIYAFLENLAEEQGAWTDLLRLHMRKENWKECVRLVETHVKHWRPDPRGREEDKNATMMLDVPLLVQLQRALRTAASMDVDLCLLERTLEETLDTLKTTLQQVSQRLI